MKYWLFDGKDVLGPFTLQTLAARTDFSATSLICAGETGEESDGWQLASSFEIFRFHPVSGQLEGVFLPDGKEVTAADIPAENPPLEKPEEKPEEKTAVQPENTAEQPKPQAEKTVEEPATVMLAREDVDLVLPEHPESTPASVSEPQSVPPQKPEEPAPEHEQTPTQEQPEEQPAPHTPQPEEPQNSLTVTPQEEIISTCTLPLVNEILEQSDLPQLPQGDFEPVPLPDTPEFELKEISAGPQEISSAPAEIPSPAQTADLAVAQEESAQEEPQELVAISSEQPATPQEMPATPEEILQTSSAPQAAIAAPRPPREQTLHRLEQALADRQAVPGIPERQTPTHQKAYTVLLILLGIIVLLSLVIFGLSRMKTHPADSPSKTADTPAVAAPKVMPQTSVSKPAVSQTAPAQTPVAQKSVTPPKPVTAQDKALSAVQNYQLPDNKGTVAAYFDRVYQDHLSKGYTASWSVEPLHKSIYIVKYRLTKTRTEPIVYVFEADGVRGKLTGALNNIALDLVGRINQN